jgi:hypothetical protein
MIDVIKKCADAIKSCYPEKANPYDEARACIQAFVEEIEREIDKVMGDEAKTPAIDYWQAGLKSAKQIIRKHLSVGDL